AAEVLEFVLAGDPVDARLGGLAAVAEADLGACLALKFEGGLAEGVGQGRSVGPLLAPAAFFGQGREPSPQPLVEAGQTRESGTTLQPPQIDPCLEGRDAGPHVRAAQRQHFPDVHFSSCRALRSRVIHGPPHANGTASPNPPRGWPMANVCCREECGLAKEAPM